MKAVLTVLVAACATMVAKRLRVRRSHAQYTMLATAATSHSGWATADAATTTANARDENSPIGIDRNWLWVTYRRRNDRQSAKRQEAANQLT
jgi:hypothetical protein